MALDFLKLPSAKDAKTRILYVLVGVVGVAILGYAAYRFFGGSGTSAGTSRVAAAPGNLQSVPGSQLSPEYYQALKQANTQAAQQAQMSGGSAVPTLMNVPGAGFQQGGCTVLCPSPDDPDVINDLNDLVKNSKLSQEDANKLSNLAKQNVTPEEFAAHLDDLVRQGKLTPEQARKLLADYTKQHANTLLADSAKTLDAMVKAGLPLAVANEVLDLQKRNLSPAEYQTELQRLVREGKLTPEQAAKLLAQYTQQRAQEQAKRNQFQMAQMAQAGEITPAVAASLTDLQKKNISVDDYAKELDRLVKEGKLTPEAAAKLLAQYKQQKLGAALDGCLGKLMKMGGDKTTEAQHLLDMQSANAPLADYLTELKRGVGANLISPEMAVCLLQEYQAATAPVEVPSAPATLLNIPGADDFAKLQQRLKDQGATPTTPPPTEFTADQFAALQTQTQQQVQTAAAVDQAQIISDLETAMSAQAQQLISTAWVTPTMEHKGGGGDDKVIPGSATGQSTSSSTSSTSTGPSGAPIIKAGTIYFAILDTAANSDYPDTPIMATIVQGPYKGAKLLGKMALAQSQGAQQPDRMSLTFNLMNMDQWPTSKAITAFAIDPDTAKTVLASSVDYHYLKKYGAIMATSFLSGYANAVMASGSSSTSSVFGTTTSNPQLSPASKLAVGIGQIGNQLSNIVQNYTTIPPTVKVNAGVGLGILYMADVTP